MGKLKFNPEVPLYTSDGRGWKLEELKDAMRAITEGEKPLVLFIHGRGKEPNKAIYGSTFTEGKAIHKIELGYDARVLMFNWDSAFKGFSIFDRDEPLSHTADGAESLGRVLHELASYYRHNQALAKPALLVHSMGSIVVQKAVQAKLWPAVSGGLFTSVLLSQPDADDMGHEHWLKQLASLESTFLTLNKDDHVLQRSTDARPPGCRALGLGAPDTLAPNATYVDLSRMGELGMKDEDHEVFAKGAMNGQIHVCTFFEQVLKGKAVELALGKNVESVDREVVFRLKSKHQPGAPCLKAPKLP